MQAVKNGTLPESCVDDSARRVLKLVFRAAETLKATASCDYEAHHALAKRAAAEGAVLLKNEGGILPLQQGAKIAVIGAMAKSPRYQGAGSSHINPTGLSQPLDFLPDAIYAPAATTGAIPRTRCWMRRGRRRSRQRSPLFSRDFLTAMSPRALTGTI